MLYRLSNELAKNKFKLKTSFKKKRKEKRTFFIFTWFNIIILSIHDIFYSIINYLNNFNSYIDCLKSK